MTLFSIDLLKWRCRAAGADPAADSKAKRVDPAECCNHFGSLNQDNHRQQNTNANHLKGRSLGRLEAGWKSRLTTELGQNHLTYLD